MAKDIRQLVKTVQEMRNCEVPPESLQSNIIGNLPQIINQTIERLVAIKPAAKIGLKNTSQLGIFKRELTFAFAENCITTLAQIENGLATARRDESPWLPSIGQFVSWCCFTGNDVVEESFLRLMHGGKCNNDIEQEIWSKSCFEFKTKLTQEKGLKYYTDEYRRFERLKLQGEELNIVSRNLIGYTEAPSQREHFEKKIQARCGCKKQTSIEKRMHAIRATGIKTIVLNESEKL